MSAPRITPYVPNTIGAAPVLRTGSTIAFDVPAIYNTPGSPSNGSVTLDLTNATVCEVVAYFNHAAEPSWPSGVFGYGVWNNSAVNAVRFIRVSDTQIAAVIVSDAAASYVNPTTSTRLTSGDVVNTTTTAAVVTGISKTLTAGKTYTVRGQLHVSGTGTGGIRVGFQGAGVSSLWVSLFGWTTVNTSYISSVAAALGIIAQTYATSSSTNGLIKIEGTIICGGSNQLVDLIMASATAGQNATVYALGSELDWIEHA